MKSVKLEYSVWLVLKDSSLIGLNREYLVSKFVALGDAVNYAIWRVKEGNERKDTFEVRNSDNIVLLVKEHEVYLE